ncbi:MAG: methyltransferase domain-containing protein [Mariprofundaceae bacterium]
MPQHESSLSIEGDLVEGRAVRILPGGETWVRTGQEDIEGLLVPNAVPGDRLRLWISGRRRGVWRGTVADVLEPADDRVSAPCPSARDCGGCALQFLDPDRHAAIKSAWVQEAFAACMTEATDWQPIHGRPACHARRRARWHLGRDPEPCLGFRGRSSHQVVAVNGCMAVTERLNVLREHVTDTLGRASGWRSLQVTELYDGIHAVFEGDAPPKTIALPTSIDGKTVCWWWRNAPAQRSQPLDSARWPVRMLHDRLPAGERWVELAVGPDDFVQAQESGNRELLRQVQAWCGQAAMVVDLFCGMGNLSLPLAKATDACVLGADANPASVAAANRNARRLRLDARFRCIDLHHTLPDGDFAGADLMLIDAPRSGAKRVCAAIERLWPRRIIMVSCDPAAGGRDGRLLVERGWRLRALRALDLFSWSGHVEAISLWDQG